MSTARTMMPALDTIVTVQFESVCVLCRVLDVKEAYGRPRLQVQPTEGYGSQWVEMNRIKEVGRPKQVTA